MTPEQRSKCMSKIRSRNTRPEMIVRRFLFSHGFRYRIHARPLPGTPDVVIVGLRTCIFINGCFWHGHEGCTMYRMPQTNVDYWTKKIEHNRQRDHETRLRLKSMGWHMVEVWECQLKLFTLSIIFFICITPLCTFDFFSYRPLPIAFVFINQCFLSTIGG